MVVNLTNNLPDTDGSGPLKADPVSLLFFGQEGVSNQEPVYEVTGDKSALRSFSAEAAPGGGSVTYTFTAWRPGTYYYHSGTYPHKQIDMGLIGGLIIRPAGYNPDLNKRAYSTDDSVYDREYLLMLSAIDPIQHNRVAEGLPYQASSYLPAYWFINGRSFPDTIAPDNANYLPYQPMGSLVQMYPGERILFRMVTLDRDVHPFHHHGNHASVIAHNGRLLQSSTTTGMADLAVERFTQTIHAGESFDAIYSWEGKDLGFDSYGHLAGDPLKPVESPLGHGENLPLYIPDSSTTGTDPIDPTLGLMYGEFYSGSPFLGKMGELPSGHTSFNQAGEHYMMFHSHHEVELQNFDEGPGGILTQIMILSH